MSEPQFQLGTVTRSFFDRDLVLRAVDGQKRSVLSRFGAYVMRRARSMIRPARQMQISEMTADELLVYRIRQSKAKRDGLPAPKRPLASSKPGEPPRSILNYLRKYLFFAWDASTQSVVVGPALFSGAQGTAPRTLEEGGRAVTFNGRTVLIKPRPFMRPAFDAELPGVPRLWADAAASFGRDA